MAFPPHKHPSPPDEARRLQPDTELFRVPGAALLQAWLHLRRGAHRRVDRRVSLQRGAEFCELLAELVQRAAADDLDESVPRVLPQGSQHRVRRGLRRQTRQVRVPLQQQVDQRVHGLVRILRVVASTRRFFDPIWFGCFSRQSSDLQRHNL